MTIYSLEVLVFLFGTSLLFHVQFKLLLLDLHTGFSRGRSGGMLFPSLPEFSTVSCDPHSQRLWRSPTSYVFHEITYNVFIICLVHNQHFISTSCYFLGLCVSFSAKFSPAYPTPISILFLLCQVASVFDLRSISWFTRYLFIYRLLPVFSISMTIFFIPRSFTEFF